MIIQMEASSRHRFTCAISFRCVTHYGRWNFVTRHFEGERCRGKESRWRLFYNPHADSLPTITQKEKSADHGELVLSPKGGGGKPSRLRSGLGGFWGGAFLKKAKENSFQEKKKRGN